MRRFALIAVAILSVLALAVAGCGESDSEQAQDVVCDARGEIQSSVESLRSLTPSTATADQVQSDVENIQSNLATIADNEDELDEDRRSQISTARAQFELQLDQIAKGLATSSTPQEAVQQYRTSVAALNTAYEEALAPIDCS
jgi:uncharacterized phage infection (PIP) family protein YhgE